VRCPFCNHADNKVVDSRVSKDASVIRRRRQCLACDQRFTTYERVEELETYVVKRDGSREPFDRAKIERGIMLSLRKRPVDLERVERFLDRLEASFSENNRREIPARDLGEAVLNWLREVDDVGYVRFASVYRDFGSVEEFMTELRNLMVNGENAI
jgi:transcriptional repressor NrdR